MNRETRRLLERQGSISADGTPVAPDRSATGQRTAEPRASLPQFLREVRAEMRKVTWPGRPEIINYTLVVLFMLALMMAVVYGLDQGFSRAIFALFD
jgi:preprotein translocase subunit SecE